MVERWLYQKESDLKAKHSPGIQELDQVRRLENLKSTLMKAYKEDELNNRKAHEKNKT